MDNVSRPLIAVLLATVAFFALWLVALKPSSSSPGRSSSSQGLGSYQSALDKAHQAVGTQNNASLAHGGTLPGSATQSTPATAATPAVGAPVHISPSTRRFGVVQQALQAHKVLALLFYNPSAPDDQAVKQELASVPTESGRVVKLEVPISELSRYSDVIRQVPISTSPTLVLIDPDQQASTIVGFADGVEIAQRVQDALAVP